MAKPSCIEVFVSMPHTASGILRVKGNNPYKGDQMLFPTVWHGGSKAGQETFWWWCSSCGELSHLSDRSPDGIQCGNSQCRARNPEPEVTRSITLNFIGPEKEVGQAYYQAFDTLTNPELRETGKIFDNKPGIVVRSTMAHTGHKTAIDYRVS